MTDKPERLGPTYWLSTEEVEDPERYEKGGLHPVHLGEELHHGRYRIVHKLGHGTYSTVWLVQDQQKDQYAALKIAAADVPKEMIESQILRRLGLLQEIHGHEGRSFVPEVLDEFEVQGPNGNHQCIVLEPLGVSLYTAFDNLKGGRLPSEVSRKVAMQLAEGLSFLHACGVVHGDLYEQNILFRLPSLSQWTAEQVYSCFGQPRKTIFCRRDDQPLTHHAPKYAVLRPLARKLLPLCLADPSIRFVDFGEAFLSTKCIPKHLHTPMWFAAPEVFFRDPVGPPSDIWALACLLYNVFGNENLFPSFFGDQDEVLSEMICTFGKFPDRWWSRWEKRAKYFTEDGTGFVGGESTSKMDIQKRLQLLTPDTLGGLEPEEIAAFKSILLGMLRYEPDERMSAKEVVQLLPRVCGKNRVFDVRNLRFS